MYLDQAVEEIFRLSLVPLDFYTLDFYTEKPIERVRALWLGGRFTIRGRPWSEEFDRPTGDAIEIGPYEDMHIYRGGKNGDTLRIYQRPKKGSQLGWSDAVWGELTISDDGFARLRESLRSGEISAPKQGDRDESGASKRDDPGQCVLGLLPKSDAGATNTQQTQADVAASPPAPAKNAGKRWWAGPLGEFLARKTDSAIQRQTPDQLERQFRDSMHGDVRKLPHRRYILPDILKAEGGSATSNIERHLTTLNNTFRHEADNLISPDTE